MATGRLPVGLTLSMFVAAVSLGVMTIAWNVGWPVDRSIALLTHLTAGLCLVWMLAALALPRARPALAQTQSGRDMVAVLNVGALTTGLVAVVTMIYATAAETVCRTLGFSFERTWRIDIWPSGFIDLTMLAVVITLAWRRKPNRELLTVTFWLVILGCLWAAFQVPAVRTEFIQGFERVVVTQWATLFTIFSSLALTGFVIATGWAHRWHRLRAWPDQLSILTEPVPEWPGFRYSVGMMGAIILILSCVHLVVPGTGMAALAAGAAVLALAARRWHDNLGDVGLGLISVGVVATVIRTFPEPPRWWTPGAWAEVFNEALLGLAVMTGLWYWLSGVWQQQLDHGKPWTTTGHLVRNTRRVGYLCAATGVLVSFHLALWPRLVYVYDIDAGPWRWGLGLTANGLLILALILAAHRTKRAPQGWLTFLVVGSTIAFAIVRAPQSTFAQVCAHDWALLLAATAVPMVLLAALVSRSQQWKAFLEPTYMIGTVMAPLAAIASVLLAGLTPIGQLKMPPWIAPATFGVLTVSYALAAVTVGPRTFAAVAVLCAGMGLRALQQMTGSTTVGPAYVQLMLLGLSLALLAWVVGKRRPGRAVRFLQWAGAALAVGAVLAGLIVAR